MKVVFRDSAEEVPMPGSAREVLPFLHVLWLWEVNFFWYLAVSFEMTLLFFLGEKSPALGRNRLYRQRLVSLLACSKCLTDEMDCDIHFDSEAAFFRRMPKGFWGPMRWARNFVWGKSLMAECWLCGFIEGHVGSKWLRDKLSYRALAVGVTGANLLTDGRAWPGIETPGCARHGASGSERNEGGE